MRDEISAFIGRERKCAFCGKTFIIYPQWVYRRGSENREAVFCSYKCLRSSEAGRDRPKRETQSKIKRAILDGLNNHEIMVLLGVDYRRVWYWREKLRMEAMRNERETGGQGGSETD